MTTFGDRYFPPELQVIFPVLSSHRLQRINLQIQTCYKFPRYSAKLCVSRNLTLQRALLVVKKSHLYLNASLSLIMLSYLECSSCQQAKAQPTPPSTISNTNRASIHTFQYTHFNTVHPYAPPQRQFVDMLFATLTPDFTRPYSSAYRKRCGYWNAFS